MSIEEIDSLEESLPEEVSEAFNQANDKIADLNLLLSQIDGSPAPYVNGGNVDPFNGYDFVNEMTPSFPQLDINLDALGDMSFINTPAVEVAFNKIAMEIRTQSCQKVRDIIALLRPVEVYQLRLQEEGLEKEDAKFVSVDTEMLGNPKSEEKTVLISPNIVLSEYLKIRLGDTYSSLVEIWKGIFNNDEVAKNALDDFSIGKVNFDEFCSQINNIPSVKIEEYEAD